MNQPPSTTTQKMIQDITSREQLGRKKYGADTDRTDLAPHDWLNHMYEELLDGAAYSQALQRTMRIKEAAYSKLITDIETYIQKLSTGFETVHDAEDVLRQLLFQHRLDLIHLIHRV